MPKTDLVKTAGALGCAGIALLGAASAMDRGKWFVRSGPAYVDLADRARFEINGAPVADAGLGTEGQVTGAIEVGRFLTQNFAVALVGGIPPEARAQATGAVATLGELADVRYGPAAILAQYHLHNRTRITPYAGVGAAYMFVFGVTDGAFQDVEMDNDLGFAWQVGSSVEVNDKFAVFADAKKAYLTTESRGFVEFSGTRLPAAAEIDLDPLVVQTGVSLRF